MSLLKLSRPGVLVLCCLILAPAASAAPLQFDAVGDNPGGLDITTYTGDYDGASFNFTITFTTPISAPSGGLPNAVYGFVDLDTDKNAATGGTAPWGGPIPGGNSWINFFYPFINLGDEYFVDLGSESNHPGLVDIFNASTGFPVGAPVSINYLGNTVSFSIPKSYLGSPDPFNFNYGIIAGDINGFPDRAPDGLAPAVITPEPASLSLFAVAVLGACGYGWRRRRAA